MCFPFLRQNNPFFTFSNVSQIQSKHFANTTSKSNLDGSQQHTDSVAIQTNNVQLLLCGDLNSLPNSGVVQYLQDGRISTDHKDFKNIAYKNTLKKMLSHSPNQESYTHAFKVSHCIFKSII